MLNKKIIDGMGNLGKASGDLCFLKGTLESKIKHLEEIKEKGYLGLDIDGTIKDIQKYLNVVTETQHFVDTGTHQIIEGWGEDGGGR